MNKISLFCIDPGGSTGVAWADVDLDRPTVKEAMATRTNQGSATVISSSPLAQAKLIARMLEDFRRGKLNICIEEWHPQGKRDREGSSPPRIAWAFLGYVSGSLGYEPWDILTWVQPSAQRHATQKRLKPMDAWVVGKEHERAAHALMVERLMGLMGS